MPTFDTPAPIDLTVDFAMAVAYVTIAASDRTDTVVEVLPDNDKRKADVRAAEATTVHCTDGRLLVNHEHYRTNPLRRTGGVRVHVALPTGSNLHGIAAVGSFVCTGRLGACHVTLHSGDVAVEDAAGQVIIQNEDGHSRIDTVEGHLRMSGINGAMTVGTARGDVEARTANGGIRIGSVEWGAVSLSTAAGDLDVGIREGTAAWLDVRTVGGNLRNSLDTSDSPQETERTVQVRARTYAGDIIIRRAG